VLLLPPKLLTKLTHTQITKKQFFKVSEADLGVGECGMGVFIGEGS
jgi:hypothetical protein